MFVFFIMNVYYYFKIINFIYKPLFQFPFTILFFITLLQISIFSNTFLSEIYLKFFFLNTCQFQFSQQSAVDERQFRCFDDSNFDWTKMCKVIVLVWPVLTALLNFSFKVYFKSDFCVLLLLSFVCLLCLRICLRILHFSDFGNRVAQNPNCLIQI